MMDVKITISLEGLSDDTNLKDISRDVVRGMDKEGYVAVVHKVDITQYAAINDYDKVEVDWSTLLVLMEAATNTTCTYTEYKPELDEWTYFFDGSPLHGMITVDQNNRIVSYTLEGEDDDRNEG